MNRKFAEAERLNAAIDNPLAASPSSAARPSASPQYRFAASAFSLDISAFVIATSMVADSAAARSGGEGAVHRALTDQLPNRRSQEESRAALPRLGCYRARAVASSGLLPTGGDMATISAGAKRELVNAAGERYRQACRKDRRHILDEFVALTGYHRKHAIRVLGAAGAAAPGRPRTGKSRIYTEAVTQALTVLWEASDRVCGKRLKALLPVLVPALERHRHLKLETEVRRLVLVASSATIDRLLSRARAATPGRRRRGSGKPAIRRDLAVRTFADWKDPLPGHLEIDLVAHCGESASGAFANTLVMTDIATGWTECVALLVREGALVADALESMRGTMPFPLRGIDSDNGSEFINETVLEFCRAHNIEFTRSRPHHKNDQAWAEQKNGAVVRRLVG